MAGAVLAAPNELSPRRFNLRDSSVERSRVGEAEAEVRHSSVDTGGFGTKRGESLENDPTHPVARIRVLAGVNWMALTAIALVAAASGIGILVWRRRQQRLVAESLSRSVAQAVGHLPAA